MQTLGDVRLEPVLELEPGKYSKTETRGYPERFGPDAPDEWEQYWRACLADSGLIGLINLRPGSWQVPVRTLTDSVVLEKIMANELEPEKDNLESLSVQWDPVLNGGFALLSDQRPVIEAQCCGDLSNHADWHAAARHSTPDWQLYWIGHPQLPARLVDGWLELAKPNDESPFDPLCRVRPGALQEAVEEARAELKRFVPRVERVLGKWPVKENVHELALNLAGLRQE